MTRLRRLLEAAAIAMVATVSGAADAHAQSSLDREINIETVPGNDGTDAEGGLFDLLQSGENITVLSGTPGGNVMTIPVGEPEDRLPIYRTICVRLCDGYYFPMSPSSSRNDFARDQQNCESICPGAEMRTYYQLSTEHRADTMMSAASEELYSELPTAYRYKRSDAPDPAMCGCGEAAVQTNYSIIAGDGKGGVQTPAPHSSFVSLSPPPAVSEAAAAAPVVDMESGPRAVPGPSSTGRQNVRVVGPKYLPAQGEAGVPPGPAPTKAR